MYIHRNHKIAIACGWRERRRERENKQQDPRNVFESFWIISLATVGHYFSSWIDRLNDDECFNHATKSYGADARKQRFAALFFSLVWFVVVTAVLCCCFFAQVRAHIVYVIICADHSLAINAKLMFHTCWSLWRVKKALEHIIHTHTQTHTLSQFDCSAQRSSVHLLSTRISAKKIAKPRTFLANMRFASWYFRAYLFNSVYNVHSTLNLYFLGLICEKFILPYRRNIWELVSLAAPYVWRFQLLITRLNAHFLFRLNTHKKSHD